ncbi:MAG: hypothetical protein HC821_04725, partial [Lewinella sp.]|nr:hypothetical protein [Lewinella sp.]
MLLRWAVAALFLGFGLQGWFAEYPLRTLLWDEGLLRPILAAVGISWERWVSSAAVDTGIQYLVRAMASFFVVAGLALAVGFWRPWLLLGGGILLGL